MDFYNRIAENTHLLNKSDNEILSYCIRNNKKISEMKVQQVADTLGGYSSCREYTQKIMFDCHTAVKVDCNKGADSI